MVIERRVAGLLSPPPFPSPHAILYFCKNRHNIVIEKLLLSSKFINAINIVNIKTKYEHTHTSIQWKYIILLLHVAVTCTRNTMAHYYENLA